MTQALRRNVRYRLLVDMTAAFEPCAYPFLLSPLGVRSAPQPQGRAGKLRSWKLPMRIQQLFNATPLPVGQGR